MSKPSKKACGENGKCPNPGACKKAAKKAFDKKGGEKPVKATCPKPAGDGKKPGCC